MDGSVVFGRRLDLGLEGVWRRGYSIRIEGWFCGGLLLSLHDLYLVGSVSWCEGILNRIHVGIGVSVRVNVRDSVKGHAGDLCGNGWRGW